MINNVVVYTGKKFSGDKFVIDTGNFNFTDKIKKTITGIIAKKEFPVDFERDKVNFKDDSIRSIQIGPYLKVSLYENTDKGGRWIIFENSNDDVMSVEDLGSSKYDFSDKISRIEVVEIKDKSKKFQSSYILNAFEKEGKEGFIFGNPIDGFSKLIILILIICLIGFFVIKRSTLKNWFGMNGMSWNSSDIF